ncbi:MAG: lysophospholipid acyltransferase family protein, partial [Bacteroidota bacterium]
KLNLYFVAARETMEKGILPKIFALAGAVSVDRTWRQGEEMIQREVNPDDTKSIGMAIEDGWVITFPQGTTREGAPVRKGTAHIIKQYQPTVVPVRVGGFRKAFNKTGLKKLERGVKLTLDFGEPLVLDYENMDVEELVEKISKGIGIS